MYNAFLLNESEILPFKHRINGTIKEVLDLYGKKGVPSRQLLSDYLDVLTYPQELKEALNPWEYLYTGIKKQPVICGVSVSESLFNCAAMKLAKQKPLEVIKSIYYRSDLRNDCVLENYFLDSIDKTFLGSKSLMVINPSPMMVEYFADKYSTITHLLNDNTLAQLYSKQYKNNLFKTIQDDKLDFRKDVAIMNLINLGQDSIIQLKRNYNQYNN